MNNTTVSRYSLHNICIELGIALKRECDLRQVILKTTNGTSIPYPQSGFNCSGYFVAFPHLQHPLMGFAMGIEINDLIPTILHEWSHMDQWAEGDPVWTNNMFKNGETFKESVDMIDEWMKGADIQDIDKYIDASVNVELDCEIRTIKKLHGLHLEDKLKFNIEEYIQKANSYIYLYRYIKETKCWNITGQAPYLIEDVWKKFPKEFGGDYSKLSDEHRELYAKFCFQPSK